MSYFYFVFRMTDYQDRLEEFEQLEQWEYLHQRPERRFIRRSDPFKLFSDEEFVQLFRFSKTCVNNLVPEMQDHLPF